MMIKGPESTKENHNFIEDSATRVMEKSSRLAKVLVLWETGQQQCKRGRIAALAFLFLNFIVGEKRIVYWWKHKLIL